MNNTNNQSARESFIIAKKVFYNAMRDKFQPGEQGDQKCRQWVDGLKLSQGEVRTENLLTTTTTNYRFGVLKSDPNNSNVVPVFNTENRLNPQDTLLVNEMGIFVGKPASNVDTAWELRSYGSFLDFGAAPGLAINTTLFSHGAFKMGVNNDVVIPYRGLFNHWYKPQTQNTAAIAAASPDDQLRGAEDGFITVEPNVLLIGSKGYVPEIILPTALATVANAFSRVVIIFRGILAQNSTIIS